MHPTRLTSRSLLVALAVVALLPATALAQSQISGQVTDSTGAALPGVTVEATSPVLAEGSRLAITDAQGNFTFVGSLRPGTYRLTFTLPGFRTQVRDGLELVADVALTVGVTLTVGADENMSLQYLKSLRSLEQLRLLRSGLLQVRPSDDQTREVGEAGSIQLCEVDPDGTVERCRRIVATGRLFR